ncbi:hypothetical protein NDU88_000021 [Pleurodeles waltl]|uniref:Uncharacterized protein n=1 Tax=Pleurodeles waltl TaxID=8319 RepID=A0AAV7S7H5_PLEWA|nr:hypothetical protein NDU88_000021 [Pleurodeles waltl]
MDVPRREEALAEMFPRRKTANKPCLLQGSRLGFLDTAVAQEGPGCRHLDEEIEGAPSKSGSPHGSRQHPQKYRIRHLEEE